MVERNLAKVEVASSSLVSRSNSKGSYASLFSLNGVVAKRLCTGLQIRVGRFDSGPTPPKQKPLLKNSGFFHYCFTKPTIFTISPHLS